MEISTLLSALFGLAATALLGWLTQKLSAFLNAKITDDKVKSALAAATDTVLQTVKSVSQTLVDRLKKEGVFTEPSRLAAKATAKNLVLQQLPSKTLALVQQATADFDLWLDTAIEAAVADGKRSVK